MMMMSVLEESRRLFHKIGFRLKPQIGLYERLLLRFFLVNLEESVFHKDEDLNEKILYGTALGGFIQLGYW